MGTYGRSRRDQILAMIRQLRTDNGLSNPLSQSVDLTFDLFDTPAPTRCKNSVAAKWGEQFDELLQSLPEEVHDRKTFDYARFEVERIYAGGEIQGVCHDRGDAYQVYACCRQQVPPAGCSCSDSFGEAPCKHIEAFVDYLASQLSDDDTPLSRKVNSKRFSTGKPDRSRYKVDRGLLELKRLDVLIKSLPVAQESLSVDLPPVKEQVEQRLVWNFSSGGGVFELHPMVQQLRKRGGGFTKGKRISHERLKLGYEASLSAADAEVIDAITFAQDRYGYRSTWTLDPLVAIEKLVGQSNVLLNDESAKVEPLELGFTLSEIDGLWRFVLMINGKAAFKGKFVWSEDQVVAIDFESSTLLTCMLPPSTVTTMRALLVFPPLEKSHLPALIDKGRQLQKVVNLRLPEDAAGPLQDVEAKPCVVLRSRLDGSLDYGIRVRDSSGAILKPGALPAVRATVVDGKPVQLCRNLASEIKAVSALADELGFSTDVSDGWNGTIRDFGQGLQLLDTLQSQHEGVELLWDSKSEKPPKMLGSLAAKNVRVDITSKRNWFGISGQCDFGKQTMPLDELLQNLTTSSDSIRGDFVRVGDGQWAKVSESLRERLTRLKDATNVDRKTLTLDATSAPAIRDLIESDIEVKAAKNWHQCLARLERAENLDPVLPAGLKAELRDYQLEGFKWLRKLAEWGVGGVLADDMGLGKTLQTLAVLLDRASEGPSLVIAPTSVGFNWVREAQRFTPDLNVILYRETDREECLANIGPGDLVVCSYGLALRDESALSKVEWGTVVMDEAQAVKNSRSKTSQAIANLNSKWTVALTGTPVENHLGELWSLFHLVSPGVFGGWENFRKRFALPIEKHSDDDARRSLSQRIKPFVLRRTKSQVLTELPPRTETNFYVDLSPEERDQYDRVRLSAIGEIDAIASLPNIQDQRFKLLALLTRLRQFSCHPGIVNKQWTGSSAKLDHLCQTLENLKEEGHRALVFSQFTEHLALIRKAFEERGISYEYLDGSTPAAARQQRVDDFQNGTANAFLISLKAGGTGLNLTAADYVIHMDPWWNPAVEDQATDRAHRIGQDKPVMVYRIIARGTIEEEILALHDSKRDLVAGVLEGTTAAGSLSTADMLAMIRGE